MPNPSALSIVHVLAPARFGGLETVVSVLASEQRRQGDDVCVVPVFAPGDEKDHPLVEALQANGVPVEPVVVPGRGYRQERARIREVLRRRGADVLHSHGYRTDVVDAPVARGLGVPVVCTVHGYTGGGLRNRLYEWLQVRASRRFDAVIAVSERLGGELVARGVPASRVHTVPNAWRPAREPAERAEARSRLGLDPAGRLVGWVGRMSEEKGPEVMVRALAELTDPEVRLSMVGSGPSEERCRALAVELEVADRIVWHGPVEGAGLLLTAFDVLAMTSWTEGTPMVLLEAMAAEVPVVATSVGGIPGVVSASEALLCEPGDSGGIARAIGHIFEEGDAAQARARAARHRLETEFDVAAWARRHREIYESVTGVR